MMLIAVVVGVFFGISVLWSRYLVLQNREYSCRLCLFACNSLCCIFKVDGRVNNRRLPKNTGFVFVVIELSSHLVFFSPETQTHISQHPFYNLNIH